MSADPATAPLRLTIATGPLLPVPALDGGAVPRMWEGLAREFAARGHAVTIVARADARQPAEESRQGVRYRRIGGFAQSRRALWNVARGLPDALRVLAALPRSDLLVSNDFWLPLLAPSLRPAAGSVVVSANRQPKGQYRWYGGCAAITAPSRALADAIAAEAPRLRDRIALVPNAVDLGAFSPEGRARSGGGPLRILFAGRLHPEKGLDLLVEAVRLATQARAGLVVRLVGPSAPSQGGGGLEYEQSLRERAGGLPIEFVGPEFDAARLAAHYRWADLFCYPSVAEAGETFGVAVAEAMACGSVPVVSALACFRDLVEHERNGLVFDHRLPQAAGQLGEILVAAAAAPEGIRRLAEPARRRAEQFGLGAVAGRFLEVFRQVQAQR